MDETCNHDIAQIVGFASQKEVKSVQKKHIYENLDNSVISAQTEGVSFIVDDTDVDQFSWELEDAKPGDKIKAISPDDYQNFIQSLGGKKEQVITYIEERLNNYEQYKEPVLEFLKQIGELDDTKEHQSHIAQNVFNIVIGGENYVLRYRPHPGDVAHYLIGSSFIEGVDHFEQIIAASPKDGVTIAEKVPGETLNRLNPEILANASDEHLSQCFDDLLIAWQRDLPMENKGKNILYDEKDGFGFIDFTSSISDVSQAGDTITQKGLFDYYYCPVYGIIINYATPDIDWKPKTKEVIQENIVAYQRKIELTKRLYQIVLPKLDGKDEARVLFSDRVQDDLGYYSEKIKEHTDEEWVSSTLRKNNEQV